LFTAIFSNAAERIVLFLNVIGPIWQGVKMGESIILKVIGYGLWVIGYWLLVIEVSSGEE
jgi:hypothetical protein